MIFEITDSLSNNSWKHLSLLREALLLPIIYMFYLSSSSSDRTVLLSCMFVILLVRYLVSWVTRIEQVSTKRKHFQIGTYIATFYLILSLLQKNGHLNKSGVVALSVIYGFINVLVGEKFTSDVIITLFLTNTIFDNLN